METLRAEAQAKLEDLQLTHQKKLEDQTKAAQEAELLMIAAHGEEIQQTKAQVS